MHTGPYVYVHVYDNPTYAYILIKPYIQTPTHIYICIYTFTLVELYIAYALFQRWQGRDHIKKDAPELWREYKKASHSKKRDWATTWDETGNFDHIKSRKVETRDKQHWKDEEGLWFSGVLNGPPPSSCLPLGVWPPSSCLPLGVLPPLQVVLNFCGGCPCLPRLTYDDLLHECKWTPENAKTEYGMRRPAEQGDRILHMMLEGTCGGVGG